MLEVEMQENMSETEVVVEGKPRPGHENEKNCTNRFYPKLTINM